MPEKRCQAVPTTSPCATDRNSQTYAARRLRSTSARGKCAAHVTVRSCRSIADLDQAAAPSPRRHDGLVHIGATAVLIAAIVRGIAVVAVVVVIIGIAIAQAVAEPDTEADKADASTKAAPAPSCPAPSDAAHADAPGTDAADAYAAADACGAEAADPAGAHAAKSTGAHATKTAAARAAESKAAPGQRARHRHHGDNGDGQNGNDHPS